MNFKVGHLNARSLFTGFDDLKEIIFSESFQIFAVSETWLSNDLDSDLVQIPGYGIIRKDRSERGGGVALYLSNLLHYTVIELDREESEVNIEQLWIKFNYRGKVYGLGVVYRSPTINVNSAIQTLESSVTYLLPQVDELICVGDLNINQYNINGTDMKKFSSMLDACGLLQVVQEPTRVTSISETLIDIVLTTESTLVSDINVVDVETISDHRLIICNLSLVVEKQKQFFYTYREFRCFNYKNFLLNLSQVPWELIYNLDNVDDMANFLSNNIYNYLIFMRH